MSKMQDFKKTPGYNSYVWNRKTLPSSSELPDSDDKPVDNELQNLVANLLRDILNKQWNKRTDWFFGVNMGIYHLGDGDPNTAIVPDGFLSLGVDRRKSSEGRTSYVVWEENDIVPIFVLEVVSKTYGGEYEKKMSSYARLGVLYYVIYNPQFHQRDKHEPLEIYRLERGTYELQLEEPYWMEEIGLGLGRANCIYHQWQYQWLRWYNKKGIQLKTSDEQEEQTQQQKKRALQKVKQEQLEKEQFRQQAEQERLEKEQFRQQAEQERLEKEQAQQQAKQLATWLRQMGVDPDSFK